MKIATPGVLLSAMMVLAACGAGGGSGLSDAELRQISSDPRVVRLGGIAERADSLLIPSVRSHYSISAQGTTVSDSLVETMRCSGTRCVSASGESITLADLLFPDTGGRVESVRLGSRGGFDTAEGRGSFASSYHEQGGKITYDSSASSYGLWGKYGFAQVALGDGPISGSISGVSVGGTARIAIAAVFGDASDTNPAGLGSATWRGIAEAISVNTYQRRQGTAAVTIPDLSRPRVNVDVRIGGGSIGSSRWADMPLQRGQYGTGAVGRDYLQGKFHGPNHEEAYGVFDTGAYVDAFGAKRQ